ncbi:hypothetical protein ACXET9_12075 [Brachybacterium sp. DNPG3]
MTDLDDEQDRARNGERGGERADERAVPSAGAGAAGRGFDEMQEMHEMQRRRA